MTTAFKSLNNNDITTTRTLLHEAIPITGAITSGTYAEENIKTFSHGMFQSVYDYPYLSSSANHIFDITCGFHSGSALSGSQGNETTQVAKKINIYNQMAQTLVGYDTGSNIRLFDQDGDLGSGAKLDEAVFLNFGRLLTKDEIKKESFTVVFATGSSPSSSFLGAHLKTISDYGAATSYRTNSPAGEYGILYSSSADVGASTAGVGLIYYQAGIVVLTASVFRSAPADAAAGAGTHSAPGMEFGPLQTEHFDSSSIEAVLTASTIDNFATGVRNRLYSVQFNNTTELNSTIYFCRMNHNDFNYSSNPTYLSQSTIRVKEETLDNPVSYATTIGLYSSDNALLACAKLSEPLKKDPNTELTIRVRLDY